MAQLVGGILWLNLVFVFVGYCVLSPFLRGRSAAGWGSFVGLALFAGIGLVGVVLCFLVVLGVRSSLPVFGATVAVLALVGLAGGVSRPANGRRIVSDARGRLESRAERWIAAAAAGATVALCCLVLVAGFRSSPWLDDSWSFWLPKGIELSRAGLDHRLFVPNGDFYTFTSADYPLWWSIIGGLDVSAVAHIDLRALNAQIAVLYVGFAAAATRLLWGRVRRAILVPAMLLALAAPELTAQTESGGADLPLAFFFALAVIAAALWLRHGEPLLMAFAIVFVATALNTKDEATVFVVGLLAVGGCFAWSRTPRRYLALTGGVAAAFVAFAPWLVWTRANGVSSTAVGLSALDPVHLWDARSRLGPAVHEVAHQMLQPRQWFVAIPLLAATSLALAVRERRIAWLGPPTLIAAGFALLVWIYWAGSTELTFWLRTSAYRVVDSIMLATAVALPLLLERLAEQERRAPVGSRARSHPL